MENKKEIKELRLQEALYGKYRKDYERDINLFWQELRKLNDYFKILKALLDFSSYFLSHSQSQVFVVIKWSLLDAIIVRLWRLLRGNSPEFRTIRKFKNNIEKEYIKKSLKHQLNRELKKINFDKSIEATAIKIDRIRHDYLAHLKTPNKKDELRISAKELKEVYDKVCDLFDVLCFGVRRVLDHPTIDVDEFLYDIVKHSDFIKAPEQDNYWGITKEHILTSPKELRDFNYYRKKLGLPEV